MLTNYKNSPILLHNRPRQSWFSSYLILVSQNEASSAFYLIIYACSKHRYRQIDVEAGATRYMLNVLIYLVAVVTYGVSRTLLAFAVQYSILHELPYGLDQIPEALRPGSYEFWGQLHQTFRVLIAIGLTTYFLIFAKAFDYTQRIKRC